MATQWIPIALKKSPGEVLWQMFAEVIVRKFIRAELRLG